MATNVSRLSKGTPPKADAAPDVIQKDQRDKATTMKPLQFRVPESVFAEFSERAGHEFGFTKGAKSQLFLKMWALYDNK